MKLIKKIIWLLPVMAIFIASTSCGRENSNINVELIPVKSGDKWGYSDFDGKFVINPQFDDANIFIDGIAIVLKGDKYGYIDESGNYVISPSYEYATAFLGGYAWTVRKGGAPTLINKDGEQLLVMKDIERAWPFCEGLAKVEVKKDGDVKYGYINRKGEFVIKPVFNAAGPFNDGMAYVTKDEKKGFINNKGEMVICDSLLKYEIPFLKGRAIVSNVDGDFGLIDKHGKFIVNPQFEKMFPDGDWYLIGNDNGYGWCDSKGKIVINPQFEEVLPGLGFGGNDLAPVRIGGEFGYVDRKGKIIINPQFDTASPFLLNKYAIVAQNEKYGIIDKEGKFKVNPQFKDIKFHIAIDPETCRLIFADEDYVVSQYFNIDAVLAEVMKLLDKNGIDGINPDMTLGGIIKKYGKDEPDAWGSVVLKRFDLGNDVVAQLGIEGDFYDMVSDGWWGYTPVLNLENKPGCIELVLEMSGKAANNNKELAEAIAKRAGLEIQKDEGDLCYAKGKYGKYEICISDFNGKISIKMTKK